MKEAIIVFEVRLGSPPSLKRPGLSRPISAQLSSAPEKKRAKRCPKVPITEEKREHFL
ncbi:hypothetical protein [Streptomyces sp. NBC_01306]|uniref:hypothetical protein n=1 Tax=Streptomyces sp. NBC_01306 TaxID=2903819 RepID=UPI00225B3C72|nr:hypothetical protein [Streptomyces sp. NBC_01306]MCX4725912.1 hypothetical protein [Streptomyces sp. NBC_01306]